jgi:cytolysin-activating lysine-acyltransferase
MSGAEFVAQAILLMERSPLHRRWMVADLVRLIYPPTHLGQVVVVTDARGRLAGFGTIGLFSQEAAEGYRMGVRPIQPQDWRSGDELWLVDVVAPGGAAKAVTRLVRAKAVELGYKGKYIHFRRNYSGKLRFSRAMI